MNYKKVQKTHKQKLSHFISPELIANNRFKEIIGLLNDKVALTNRDRYLYGYSLLRTQKKWEALVTLWPLVVKGHEKLQEDCASIAEDIFKDESFLYSAPLTEEALHVLFSVAKSLSPNSQAYNILKQRYFNLLWQAKDYEKLERIVKSTRDDFSGVLVENLSKLAFFQAERKLTGNIPAFISLILTGAACLILRNDNYHSDIEDTVCLLANELKLLFSQLKIKKKFTWDEKLFENFVDYEAGVLIQVLQLAVKNNELNLDIIPTPGYLINYDSTTQRVSTKFLPWLAAHNKALFECYNAETYQAVLWLLSGEKLSSIQSILKSIPRNKLDPYLRLALMLRAENMKPSALKGLVQVSDFENIQVTESIFKNLVVKTVKSMANEKSTMYLKPEIWLILYEFSFMLSDSELKNILIKKTIDVLVEEYDPDSFSSSQQKFDTQMPKTSVLLQSNPFDQLGALITDTKQMIMQKVMKLIQQSPEKMASIRQAQNELFNPARRFLHQYLRYLTYDNKNAEIEIQSSSAPINVLPTEIPFRHEFLNAN